MLMGLVRHSADLAACNKQSHTEAATGWTEQKTGMWKVAETWRKGKKEGKQNERSKVEPFNPHCTEPSLKATRGISNHMRICHT
jgi:hypothetical protein